MCSYRFYRQLKIDRPMAITLNRRKPSWGDFSSGMLPKFVPLMPTSNVYGTMMTVTMVNTFMIWLTWLALRLM